MSPRGAKGQRRIRAILDAIPDAREQLIVATVEFGPGFDRDAFGAAARSADARERNKVAAVERDFEVLLNWVHELASRGLAEAQRVGRAAKAPGHPWDRLAELGAISRALAQRLQEAKELRDALGHAYPPATWELVHEAVESLLSDLDAYLDGFGRWARETEILS